MSPDATSRRWRQCPGTNLHTRWNCDPRSLLFAQPSAAAMVTGRIYQVLEWRSETLMEWWGVQEWWGVLEWGNDGECQSDRVMEWWGSAGVMGIVGVMGECWSDGDCWSYGEWWSDGECWNDGVVEWRSNEDCSGDGVMSSAGVMKWWSDGEWWVMEWRRYRQWWNDCECFSDEESRGVI